MSEDYIRTNMTNLQKLPTEKWFIIDGRADQEDITELVKEMIDSGEPFEFTNDYRFIKKINKPIF